METITSADFQRKIGHYQDRALVEPIVVTRNGRERLVLLFADEFHRLKRRDCPGTSIITQLGDIQSYAPSVVG